MQNVADALTFAHLAAGADAKSRSAMLNANGALQCNTLDIKQCSTTPVKCGTLGRAAPWFAGNNP
jgi:hypothetical protein